MIRASLVLALLGGCAHRDLSPAMERRAQRAALKVQLDAARQGLDPQQGATSVQQAPPSDLARPALVEGALAQGAARARPQGSEIAGPVEVLPIPAPPAVGPASPSEPQDLDSLLARVGSGGDPGLARALDDLRWTLHLEARLADKQRLIDQLGTGQAPTRSGAPADRAVLDRLEALGQQLEALGARQTALESAQQAQAERPGPTEGLPAVELEAVRAELEAAQTSLLADRAERDQALQDQLADQRAENRARFDALRAQLDRLGTQQRRGLFRRRALPVPPAAPLAVEPEPVEAAPVEPAPVELPPVEPAPVEPEPIEPEPDAPSPSAEERP